MSARNWLFSAAILGCWAVSSASAQQAIRWQPTLETANRVAGQANRLVLVHFWADWCKSCTQMEQRVFSRPDVAAALEMDFVPVKLNADHFPAKVREYGVTVLPTDIILSPTGQLIDKLTGTADPSAYLARLGQIAASRRNQVARTYGQMTSSPAGNSPRARPAPSGNYSNPGYQPPSRPDYSGSRYANDYNRRPQAEPWPAGPADQRQAYAGRGGAPPVTGRSQAPTADYLTARSNAAISPQAGWPQSQPALPPSAYRALGSSYQGPAGYQQSATARAPAQQALSPQASLTTPSRPAVDMPPGTPPLGLDGYCPVQLGEQQRWAPGDKRWGARHRGRTYLFAGPDEQRRFLADPDRYAPVLSGNDVVLAMSRGRMVTGLREHGAWYRGQVYLFSSERSFEEFNVDPERYAASVQQSGSNIARRSYIAPSTSGSGQGAGSPYGSRY